MFRGAGACVSSGAGLSPVQAGAAAALGAAALAVGLLAPTETANSLCARAAHQRRRQIPPAAFLRAVSVVSVSLSRALAGRTVRGSAPSSLPLCGQPRCATMEHAVLRSARSKTGRKRPMKGREWSTEGSER